MKTFAIISALAAVAMAGPIDARDGGIVIPGTTITLPTVALPTLTLPGITIPTAITIPGISTVIPFPSICPSSVAISLPAVTLSLPPIPTITISKVVTVTAVL